MGLMTLGRQPDHSQPKYFMHAYNTISEHMLKSSKSNNDLKVTPCTNIPINNDSNYIKRGSWSTLTLSHAREVCQKASATIDKALLKSKSCHQDLAYHYLQVGAAAGYGMLHEGTVQESRGHPLSGHPIAWQKLSNNSRCFSGHFKSHCQERARGTWKG